MKTLTCALMLCLLAPILLYAGDTAIFVDLGFSPDYRYFAFAQYGEQDGSGFPYAELYIVDVVKNSFAPGGVVKTTWQEDSEPLAKGIHVLLEARLKADSLFNAYNIDAKLQPRILVSRDTAEREEVEWKLQDGENIKLQLKQAGDGDHGMYTSSAAFQIDILEDSKSSKIIGNFKRFRKYVIRYDIDRVLTFGDDKAVIVVVRMTKRGFEGPDIRYMVEAFMRSDKAQNKE
jgi:predicted secreted protein